MPFLKSLFCTQGLDNPLRFLSLSMSAPVLFLFLFLLTGQSFIIASLLVIIAVAVVTLSTIRRTNDAQQKPRWIWLIPLSSLISLLLLMTTSPQLIYWFTFLSFPFLIPVFLLKGNHQTRYILGYNGPVNMQQYQKVPATTQNRIEPTLAGATNSNYHEVNEPQEPPISQNTTGTYINNDSTIAIIEQAREWLRAHIQAVTIAIGVLVISAIIFSFLGNDANDNLVQEEANTSQESKSAPISQSSRMHKIDLPDNFSLLLSEHDGVFINWQADRIAETLLWSQHTASGDKSCQNITFNNGKTIRVLDVNVELGENYFAYFSPLDTQTLIQSIAFRGSFKLCGYQFSLKGSQTALGKSPAYAKFIEY